MMLSPQQIQIWNRAAIHAGGTNPCEGDIALGALLLFHNMAMNGGVEHAIEALSLTECAAASKGFRYFGLEHASTVIEKATATKKYQLSQLDSEYSTAVPDDGALMQAFQAKITEFPNAFASVSK